MSIPTSPPTLLTDDDEFGAVLTEVMVGTEGVVAVGAVAGGVGTEGAVGVAAVGVGAEGSLTVGTETSGHVRYSSWMRLLS